VPGATLRNNKPPSESAFCVATVWPAELISDACADGARPVSYTCCALPKACTAGVVAEAWGPGIAPTTSAVPAAVAIASALLHALGRVFDIQPSLPGRPDCVRFAPPGQGPR